VPERSEECEEKVPGLNITEADLKPSINSKVSPNLPSPGDEQGSGLTPIAGPSESELASNVDMSIPHRRWPTPEQAIPRHDTVDSGVDLSHAHDLDSNKELAYRGMQEEPFTTLYVDRAVSPKSETGGARDWVRPYDIDVSNQVSAWTIKDQPTATPYADRAVSPKPQSVDTRSRKIPREKLAGTFNLLGQKRASVLALRYEVQEARSSLRHERETLNARDAQNIQKLRTAGTNRDFTEQDRLLGLLEELQTSRDILRPKEDDYERLEDQLNRKEWELKELERTLAGRSVSAEISLLGDDDIIWFEYNLEQGQWGPSTHNGLLEDSPPMERYLSRKGDVEMLKEQLTEMQAEYTQLLDDEEIRAQLGLNPGADSREILEGFDKRRDALLREIFNVEEDVSRLQDALTNKDDILFSINRFYGDGPEASDQVFTEPLTPDHPYGLDIEGVTTESEALSRDPLLLSPEESRKNEFVDTSDGNIHDGISTPRYVNQWLLHILRRSIPEIQRFKSTDELREVKLRHSREQIRDMALEWWFKDQSVRDFERSREIAALTFERSAEMDSKPFGSPEGPNKSEILTFVEPFSQVQEGTTTEAYTSSIAPPVQALTALSLSGIP
jgi:hypothetical protein